KFPRAASCRMSLSSVRSETALRSRLFSSSRSFRRFTCSVFSPPNSWRHRNTSPRSRRSGGLRPPCSGPARPEHRPAAASQRSLQACIASLPLQSSWMSKTYLKSDHFNGGGSVCKRPLVNEVFGLLLTEFFPDPTHKGATPIQRRL